MMQKHPEDLRTWRYTNVRCPKCGKVVRATIETTEDQKRIAQLEEFVRWVKIRESGCNYDSLRRQAEVLLEKDV